MNRDEVSEMALTEFTQLYDANAKRRQSPIDINTHGVYPTMTEDVSYKANFATKVSYANVRNEKGAFVYKFVGDDLEFTTSLTQWWFPEIPPIKFTPT